MGRYVPTILSLQNAELATSSVIHPVLNTNHLNRTA